MKVKIFASDVRRKDNDLGLLETEVNLWFAANPDITIASVSLTPLEQSLICVLSYYEPGQGRTVTFTLRVPDEDELDIEDLSEQHVD
jgi:hypothetical protein